MERGTITRYGLEGQQEQLFPPRMYATVNERCPVSIFKMIAHRPPDVLQPNDPFFLATIPNPKGDVWFKKQPMGVGKLGNMMKVLSQAGNLKGKKNHCKKKHDYSSHRKRCSSPMIAQLNGHKSLKSLNSYSHASIAQQQAMSLLVVKESVHVVVPDVVVEAHFKTSLPQSQINTSSSSLSCMELLSLVGL